MGEGDIVYRIYIMGDFVREDFVLGGILSRGILSGDFVKGRFCPGTNSRAPSLIWQKFGTEAFWGAYFRNLFQKFHKY